MTYAERQGTPQAWSTEPLTLDRINLVVGRNATGKSRILNAMRRAADLLAGRMAIPASAAEWRIELINGATLAYSLATSGGTVQKERFARGTTTLLDRGPDGAGRIFAEKLQQEIDFQSPPESIAALARRDLLQHQFLEPLHGWAASLHYFAFGAVPSSRAGAFPFAGLVELFQRGVARRAADYVAEIKAGMAALGHALEVIELGRSGSEGEPRLWVKESRLRAPIPLEALSQGMLRCLALVLFIQDIQPRAGIPCVLVDDLGEGLDFDRACAVVDWLMEKSRDGAFQLICSTNDRFIMNKFPLEHWTILEQEGSLTRVVNYFNSKERFDEFKFTGLSNFDFFSMDFNGGGEP